MIDLKKIGFFFLRKKNHTSVIDNSKLHSCANFVNIKEGPHRSNLRNLPKADNSTYDIPISTYKRRNEKQIESKVDIACM